MSAVVVIGAGHNGLVAAALLARAGRRVTVVEQRAVPGGLAAGEGFAEGWRHEGVLHDTARLSPTVVSALELEKHGLAWRPRSSSVVPDPAGAVRVDEAEGYAAWRAWLDRYAPFARDVLNHPAPRLDSEAALWPALRAALKLRRLGEADMMELLRVGPTCVDDWLSEWFDDARVRAALMSPALVGSWLAPRSPTSTAVLLLHALTAGDREVDGGPSALVDALLVAGRAAGVGLVCGARVARIRVERRQVRGVVLEDGTAIDADTVLSGADPRTTLLDLLDPEHCPPLVQREARGIRSRGAHAKVHLAVSAPPVFAGAAGPADRICTARDPMQLERAMDAVKYRGLPDAPPLEIRVLPQGAGAVLSVLVHGIPHGLRSGWDDDARNVLSERVLEVLEQAAPGIGATIVAREVLTPADLAERFGLAGGHLYGGEHALDQLWVGRPSLSLARHTTPIEGLVLCSGGTHPGGGITGRPGELAAAAALSR